MDNNKLKELTFKVLDITPSIAKDRIFKWHLGNYTIFITYAYSGGAQQIYFGISLDNDTILEPKPLDLTEKELCEIKLKLLNIREQFNDKALAELLELTRCATLSNKMESLLEETEYEKTHKNDE